MPKIKIELHFLNENNDLILKRTLSPLFNPGLGYSYEGQSDNTIINTISEVLEGYMKCDITSDLIKEIVRELKDKNYI